MAQLKLDLPESLVSQLFDTVKGKSSLTKLGGSAPVPFNGTKQFIFSMDGEAAIVGEGELKPAGATHFEPVVITPIKFVYQARVSDEFVHSSDAARIGYLSAFADGFAKKIARGIDIAALHGCDPKTKTPLASLTARNFDALVENVITYDAAQPDENLEDAIAAIHANERDVTGMILSSTFGAAMAKVKVNGVVQYPEFKFGGAPGSFAGAAVDMNSTLTYQATGAEKTDHVLVGDFANAFKWGYAKNIPLEVIEYGDPDGTNRDLKAYNEVCLRAEAYVGWGILDKDSFALIQA